MTTKRAKRLARRAALSAGGDSQFSAPAQAKPKEGPQRVFKRELAETMQGRVMRYRNIAITPLALAAERGVLDDPAGERTGNSISGEDRLRAGEHLERLWRVVHASDMRASSLEVSTRNSNGLFWTEARQQASDEIARLARAMEHGNFLICKSFCGEQHSIADSLRIAAIAVHPDGRAYRLREALNDLVRATHGTDHVLTHAPIRSYSAPESASDSNGVS